ncbi:hypothetical protein EDB85DRAFT_2013919 [Lactarius pseudohatsudake]|nr:hypothetical protein EDB85DRAFT_2013919 [Lactarius pseudohatsudake]
MIARVDAVQLTWLPGFDPSAWAAGDALEPPRFRRADQQRQRRREKSQKTNGRWHERCLGLRIRSQFPLFLILRQRVVVDHPSTGARRGRALGEPDVRTARDICTQPSSSRTMHPYRSSAEPNEDPAVLRLPDLKLRKERQRRCFVQSTTMVPELTLSAPAWLVASALMVGPSPTVPEMPSVGSGKAKVYRRQTGLAQHDRPGAARECPKHLRAMTSMLPSLRLRGVAPAREYLLCDTPVHLHRLRAEHRS